MFYFQSHTVVDSFYTIVIITCILTVQQDLSLLWKAMWIIRQVVKYILISFLTFSSFSNFHHDYKHVIIFTSIDLKVHVHKINVSTFCYYLMLCAKDVFFSEWWLKFNGVFSFLLYLITDIFWMTLILKHVQCIQYVYMIV